MLQFLAREIANARFFILGTYRDVEISRGHPLAEMLPRLRRERAVDRILLRGLPEEEVRAWLAALRGDDVPESFARTLSRETAGNPFFIKEVLRDLLDRGVAYREGAQWTGRVDVGEIELPESVREVIGRRLARLGEECTKLLTFAAVIGNEFSADVLRRVGDLEEDRIFEIVEEATSARVIEEVVGPIGRYRFAHTLIRETLLGTLRNLERVRLHRRVASVLEVVYARSPKAHLAELAHHFLEGLPGGDVSKAIDYATRAGDRASEQLADEQAATHYLRALQALELEEPADEKLRCELLLKLGEARCRAGGFEEPREALREAARVAERIGDPELFARAALAVAGAGIGVHLLPDHAVLDLLEQALPGIGERDSALRARVMAQIAASRTLAFGWRGHGQLALARNAVEMARRVGDKATLAQVLSITPWATWGPDRLEERLALTEELIALAGELGDQRLAVQARVWRACHFLEMGDVVAADRESEVQQRFAETSRQAYHRWDALVSRSGSEFLEGRFDEVERLGSAAMELGRGIYGEDAFVAVRGIADFLREQRVGQIVDYRSYATELRNPIWRAAVAAQHAARGELEAARREIDALSARRFADIPRDLLWFFTLWRIGEAVTVLGDSERAVMLYEILLPYANRYAAVIHTCRGSIARLLGVLATMLGRYQDAEDHYQKALEMDARIRARVWVCHTQHEYARMLLARGNPGDREKASELSAVALAAAREIGMKPLGTKLVELRAAAGFGEAEKREVPPEAGRGAPAPSTFRLDGDFWTITYEGKSLRLKDAKGLQYIALLLRHSDRELHAADLAAGFDVEVTTSADGAEVSRGLGDAGEVLDAQARSEYRERLETLRGELEEAKQWGDSGRAANLTEEIEFLSEELSAAFGTGGRARKAGDVANRARKAVTSRIRDSIARIAKEHASLGRHLENAIRTGVFCSYQPDRSPEWRL